MKTSTIHRNSATTPIFAAPQSSRRLVIACALFSVALVAHSAGAQYVAKHNDVLKGPAPRATHHALVAPSNVSSDMTLNPEVVCPPGEQRYQGKCVPVPHRAERASQPQHDTKKWNTTRSGAIPAGGSNVHKPIPKTIDRVKIKPQLGAPVEHHSSASETHGIIFVGGKNAINSQPVPPGHAPDTRSINSQPVPPGHAVHKSPQPGDPVEHARKVKIKQQAEGHS